MQFVLPQPSYEFLSESHRTVPQAANHGALSVIDDTRQMPIWMN